MLQVRAEPAESMIKKFRRNTCNGEQRLYNGKLTAKDDKPDEIIAFGIVSISLSFFCHPTKEVY